MARQSSGRGRRLVLHFDVNQTIIAGDAAKGEPLDELLNSALAKVAYVQSCHSGPDGRRTPQKLERGRAVDWGEWEWMDGTPLSQTVKGGPQVPPLDLSPEGTEGALSFRDLFGRVMGNQFTRSGSPGMVFLPLLEQMLERLRAPEGEHWPPGLLTPKPLLGENLSGQYQLLAPAFLRTLTQLRAQGRDFSVIFRTFGSDIGAVQEGMEEFAKGRHPRFPARRPADGNSPGWDCSDMVLDSRDMYSLSHGRPPFTSPTQPIALYGAGGEVVANTEEQIEGLISSHRGVMGIQDEYEFWRQFNFKPVAGKPIWHTGGDEEGPMHIFFDDNAHVDPNDSIISVRARPSPRSRFVHLSGAEGVEFQGSSVVKVPFVGVLLDEDFFLKTIHRAESAWEAKRGSLPNGAV